MATLVDLASTVLVLNADSDEIREEARWIALNNALGPRMLWALNPLAGLIVGSGITILEVIIGDVTTSMT
ncbi:hypothetical protein [Methylobacterium oryzisoli]|uniref:hypothetical protein n=1 Tax=Methylobacterium oryzisoli TaxID=3385502 RepID=UPI00389135C2